MPGSRRLMQGRVPMFAALVDADPLRNEDLGGFAITPDRETMQCVVPELICVIDVIKRHVTEIRSITDTVKDCSNFWFHEVTSAA